MGYLGTSWLIRTRRWDQDFVCELKENRWDDMSCEEKTYVLNKVPVDSTGIPKERGYCRFEIRNLRKRRQNIEQVRTTLSNVYRALLADKKAIIRIDGNQVEPLTLPEYSGFTKDIIHERTNSGRLLKGWVGRLKRDTRVGKGPQILGGMRLLRGGRLICEGEYFKHRDYRFKASLGNLIGEVELTKVPVLPNKTDFQRDSTEWQEIELRMYDILKPHIDSLLKQAEEETISREEKKRLTETRDLMIEALKLLKDENDEGGLGENKGRKPPSDSIKREKKIEISQVEKPPTITKEPKTPAPDDAVGKLKRLGNLVMPPWTLRSLDPSIRSIWEEKEGSRCLIINTNYFLYKKREGDHLYLAETASQQLAMRESPDKLLTQDYLFELNRLMLAFNQIYQK